MSVPADVVRRGSTPTNRELECVRAYAETGDYAEAAARLGIARSTLNGHLAAVRRRLGVDSTVVVIWRLRHRLRRH